jgi:hypothetical protein
MMSESRNPDAALMVSGKIVRIGLFRPKQVEISITDGVRDWKFLSCETFTIPELKYRFPYFLGKPKKGGE